MELNEVILILGLFIPLFFVGVWQLNRVNPNKKAQKAGDSSIKELYSVYNNQVSDVLKLKDKAISSLQAKLRYFEEEDEEKEDSPIDPVTIAPILQKYGINPSLLEIPFVKDKIKELTKGMNIQDVLTIVSQLKKTTASGESDADLEKEFGKIEYN